MAEVPHLWFVAGFLGAASEIWLKRQIDLIRGFSIHTVTWGTYPDPTWQVETDVHLIDGLPPGRRFPTGREEGRAARWLARLRNAPSGNFYQAGGRTRRALFDLARTCPPAAILAQYGSAGLALRPVARALGVPLVVHFHGGDISSSLSNRWYRWSLLRELPYFDGLVVVGNRQRDWLLAQGVAESRVHLIPCGVPVAEFRSDGTRLPSPPRFLTVSRLTPQKGLDICLQALSRIVGEFPETSLTIVGDGPERERLKWMAADLGLQDRVRFTGPLSADAVRREMQVATIFLQHSLDWDGQIEGFGVSVAEASAMELPVIVSRSGGLVDQVVDGTTGFIVEQRDVDGLDRAMRRLAGAPDLARQMGQAGRARVARHFDTPSQVARLEQVLLSLLPTTLQETMPLATSIGAGQKAQSR